MKIQNFIPALFLAGFVTVVVLWFQSAVDFRLLFTTGLLTGGAFVTSICCVALPAGIIRKINFFLTLLVLVLGLLLLVSPSLIGISLLVIPVAVALAIELCLLEVTISSGLFRGKSGAVPLLVTAAFFIGLILSLAIGTSLAFTTTCFLASVVLTLLGILFGYKKDFDLDQPTQYDQSTYDPKA